MGWQSRNRAVFQVAATIIIYAREHMGYEQQPLLNNEYAEFNDENIYETAINAPGQPKIYETPKSIKWVNVDPPDKPSWKTKTIGTRRKYNVIHGKLEKHSKIIRIMVIITLILVISFCVINNSLYTRDAMYKPNRWGERRKKWQHWWLVVHVRNNRILFIFRTDGTSLLNPLYFCVNNHNDWRVCRPDIASSHNELRFCLILGSVIRSSSMNNISHSKNCSDKQVTHSCMPIALRPYFRGFTSHTPFGSFGLTK